MKDSTADFLIQEAYENPLTTGNASVLYRNLKKDKANVTLRQVKEWLDGQAYKQRTKKYQPSGYYIPKAPQQEYQLDIFYFIEPDSDLKQYRKYDRLGTKTFRLNKGYKYGLVCIDIFTKFAQVKLLKKKSAQETLEATLEIFKKMGRPEMVYTDEGGEFKGVFLDKMLDLGVIPVMTLTHASFAERFIKTFKGRLYPYLNAVDTKVYYNVVDKIVENYNNTYHSVIRMTPLEATQPRREKEVRQNIYETYLKKKGKLFKKQEFKKGDLVRYIVKKELFSKDYEPSYSKDTATVEEVGEEPGDVYIRLSNGKDFLPHELRKVSALRPKQQTRGNLYSEGTLETQLRDLAKTPVVDDGSNERLKEENERDLIEKQQERKKRAKRVPERFRGERT